MTQLLQNAVYGTVLILAAAALRGALRDRLLPEARLALWAVCLFRLFTPIAPTSALSFWGLFGQKAREVSAPMTVPSPVMGAIVPAAPNVTAIPAETGVPWGTILAALWTAVGAILAARYALAYVRTRRAVSRTIPLGREDARYAALPKCARLREGSIEGAPLTFGAARPTVVLIPGLEGTELACVLAHEGVHARRRDNLWHYAAAAALTVFWWNPAVWLMARLIRRDVELSCDRAVVRRLGAERRAEYANALVTLSTQAEGGAFCHGFGPKRTEERIIAVMKYRKTTIIGIALTLALVLAVTVGFASNPADDVPDEESTTSSAPASAVWMCSFGSEGEVLSFSISLDYLEESLAEHVADGSMTEEDAAHYLEAARALSQDGVMLRWTFAEDSGLFVDKDSDGPGTVYYLDGNGNKVYLSLVEMFAAFPFPSPSDAFTSDQYAGTPRAEDNEPDANTDDQGEEIVYCTLEGCTIQGEHFHHDPQLEDSAGDTDEPIPEPQSNNGADNQPEPEPQPDDVIVVYDPDDPNSKVLEEYKALLERLVAQGGRTQAEADKMLARMEDLIERAKNGEIEGLRFNKQANGEVTCIVRVADFIGAD